VQSIGLLHSGPLSVYGDFVGKNVAGESRLNLVSMLLLLGQAVHDLIVVAFVCHVNVNAQSGIRG
jgi:hypothetical protein